MYARGTYEDTLTKLQRVKSGERLDRPSVHVAVSDAMIEIESMRACIRKLCPEIEARKLLNFATAEAIFSEPRRDQ